MKRIAVFCGSSAGARRDYTSAAVELANVLVARGISLVYGGGRVGLMGRIAESVVARGGEVVGVIPKFLIDKELAYESVSELRAVDTMSERKAVMAALSDAFIALPGGYGTLDELIEMLTWTQLDIHQKPCGLLNTCHYYDDLMAFLDHSVAEKFVQDAHRKLLLVEEEPATLVDRLESYEPPVIDKTQWILGIERQTNTMFIHQVDDNTTLTMVEMRDAEELFALVDASRMYLREWLPWVDANVSIDETVAFVQAAQKQYARGEGFQCCIRYRDKIVGVIGLHRVDRFHKQAEIGYWLAEESQGRGIMTACCRALVDFVFQGYKLHRVEIRAAVGNTKSRAIPERLGFTHEGTLREAEWVNDHFVDGAVYAMLERDWTE